MAQSARQKTARFAGFSLLLAMAVSSLGVGVGCQRVLFPENTPRTQFESNDRLRNNAAPLTEFDEFGRPQPALRSRLSPTQS